MPNIIRCLLIVITEQQMLMVDLMGLVQGASLYIDIACTLH